MRKVKNRMGLQTQTKHFNFSPKKRLNDPLVINTYLGPVSKSVETWIRENSEEVYIQVYVYRTIELTRDSIVLLKERLKNEFPEYYEDIERRKASARAKNIPKGKAILENCN